MNYKNKLDLKKLDFGRQAVKTPLEKLRLHLHYETEELLQDYFNSVGNKLPLRFYQVVWVEVEKVLLKVILTQTGGNQTRTARILGITTATLRKRLENHRVIKNPRFRKKA